MCPEGFVLGPDWKNCDDVDECAAGEFNYSMYLYDLLFDLIFICISIIYICMICMICISNVAVVFLRFLTIHFQKKTEAARCARQSAIRVLQKARGACPPSKARGSPTNSAVRARATRAACALHTTGTWLSALSDAQLSRAAAPSNTALTVSAAPSRARFAFSPDNRAQMLSPAASSAPCNVLACTLRALHLPLRSRSFVPRFHTTKRSGL